MDHGRSDTDRREMRELRRDVKRILELLEGGTAPDRGCRPPGGAQRHQRRREHDRAGGDELAEEAAGGPRKAEGETSGRGGRP